MLLIARYRKYQREVGSEGERKKKKKKGGNPPKNQHTLEVFSKCQGKGRNGASLALLLDITAKVK